MDNLRIKTLQKSLVNPLLIKKKENLQYLTGVSFENVEGWLLVKPSRRHSDPALNAGEESKVKRSFRSKDLQDDSVVFFGSGLEKVEGLKKVDRFKNISLYLSIATQLEIENIFTFAEYEYIRSKSKELRIKVKPVKSPVDFQRQIKDVGEIDAVRKSMQIVEKVFSLVKKQLHYCSAGHRPALTEIALAQFIKSSGHKMGAHAVSFPAIVASGVNAAVPHHVPSTKILKTGESIILDFGFKYKNYCSDFTRTVFLKSVPKKLEIAYNQVEKAYNGAITYVDGKIEGNLLGGTPQKVPFKGVLAGDIYQRSVDILAEKSLSKYFIHSLGHGTGLEIHELPNLSSKSKDVMKDGMIFSIEPGVYLPKIGGIRIEDLVYLENDEVKKFINVSTKLSDNIL